MHGLSFLHVVFTSNTACSGCYGGHPHLVGEVENVTTIIACITQCRETHSDWVQSSTCRAYIAG